MSIDLAGLIRRHKPRRWLQALPAGDPAKLLWLDDLQVNANTRLLLDTGVYIRQAAGNLTDVQKDKLSRVRAHHSTVCLAEIAVGLTNRDVTHANWLKECAYWDGLFSALPRNRTHAPDPEIWTSAGIIAGIITRVQGFQAHQRKDTLNDALIYLTALKLGIPVLTENRRDFEWLQQLVPRGRFYLI